MILLNLVLSTLTFIRYIFADNTISYDYQFYITFFEEINRINFLDFGSAIGKEFPYIRWGEGGFGKFECGFGILAYTLGKVFNPSVLYALIASVSIYIKLDILRRFNIKFYQYFIFFIFDITIFESNQLRAGLALAIFMVFIYNNLNKNNKILSLFLLLFSALCHLSIIILVVIFYLSKFAINLKKKYFFILLLFILESVAVLNLNFITSFFGGKIEEYNILSNNFDVYNKTSGINISSILAITFAIYFLYNKKTGSKNESWIYGFLFSGISAILIFFSNFFIILSDRIWLLCLPIILLFYSYESFYLENNKKFSLILNNIIVMELFYYIIINLLYRYPSSNFFDFMHIIPNFEFIPPIPPTLR